MSGTARKVPDCRALTSVTLDGLWLHSSRSQHVFDQLACCNKLLHLQLENFPCELVSAVAIGMQTSSR